MAGMFSCEVFNLHDWEDSARMTKDTAVTMGHIIAATTYVMWHEEHLFNVIVLQRVHLSNVTFPLMSDISTLFPKSPSCC
jgi:hypothetical protein